MKKAPNQRAYIKINYGITITKTDALKIYKQYNLFRPI